MVFFQGWKKLFLVVLILFLPIISIHSRFKFDRIEYVKVFERYDDSLKIFKYIKLKDSGDRAFVKSYWKVYYYKNKIVAEELYKRTRLVYYYMYYHTKNKIYQKGFYWHGIYREIKWFKAHGKYIKQGWIYKNYPETYRVYNKDGKLIYKYHYKNFES